jgi:putative tricarboxylic transport membrane protein
LKTTLFSGIQEAELKITLDRIKNQNTCSAVILLCFSVALYVLIIPREVPRPNISISRAMPPDFFPNCITILLGILSSIFLIGSLRDNASNEKDVKHKGFIRFVLATSFFFVYLFFIHWIGWIIATSLALPGLMRAFGSKRWIINIMAAVLVPLTLYIFFEKIALVPLPRGILFN